MPASVSVRWRAARSARISAWGALTKTASPNAGWAVAAREILDYCVHRAAECTLAGFPQVMQIVGDRRLVVELLQFGLEGI